jgi:hypothetical protein
MFIMLCACFIFTGCAAPTLYSSAGDTIMTKVQIGMSMDEVKSIMGESGQEGYVYNNRLKEQLWTKTYSLKQPNLFQAERLITIYFKNNIVVDIEEWSRALNF